MLIRRLEPRDRGSIAGILTSDETFAAEEVAVALELVDSAIAKPDGDYEALVAEEEEGMGVIGYVCYGRTPMTTATYDLYWLATHRRARGQGVGSKLVVAMEEELGRRGAVTVRVETSLMEAYGAARSFYARARYLEAGRISDFYAPGDDLIVLAKRLSVLAREDAATSGGGAPSSVIPPRDVAGGAALAGRDCARS
ncbi:MAG: GNAT family N-acetyltransferase [Pseudomonadota bacterium]